MLKKITIVALSLCLVLTLILGKASIAKAETMPTSETILEARGNQFNRNQLKQIIEHDKQFKIKLRYDYFDIRRDTGSQVLNEFFIDFIVVEITMHYEHDEDNNYTLYGDEIYMQSLITNSNDQSYTTENYSVLDNYGFYEFNLDNFLISEYIPDFTNNFAFTNRYNYLSIDYTLFNYNDEIGIQNYYSNVPSNNRFIDDLQSDVSMDLPHNQYKMMDQHIKTFVRDEIDTDMNYEDIMNSTFNSFGNILGVQIFPGITIGLIIGIPLLLGVFLIILKLIRG